LKPRLKSGIPNNSLKEVLAMLSIKMMPKPNSPLIADLFFAVRRTPFLVSCLKKYQSIPTQKTASIAIAR
jgi:hypothetical protein